jgi:hypothetical protein
MRGYAFGLSEGPDAMEPSVLLVSEMLGGSVHDSFDPSRTVMNRSVIAY